MPVAPNPVDLTTLDAVKAWLGATSSVADDTTQRAITNVSRFILSYLSRQILPATYSDIYDGYGSPQARIMLKNWPVISVASAFIGSSAVLAAPAPGPGITRQSGYLLSPGDAFPPGAQQYLDFFGWLIPNARQAVGVTYRAGYATSETLIIPATPFQLQAAALYGAWASDESVIINGVAATAVTGTPTTGQYKVDCNGLYTFAAADVGKAVVISYGYIPQDLAQAAIEMIAYRFTSRQFIGYVSKSLGGQETVTFSTKDMSDAVSSMLQNYKRVF